MTHKAWLDNEYNLWIEALESSTVDNFRGHPQVKRMLGEIDRKTFTTLETLAAGITHKEILFKINGIGNNNQRLPLSGTFLRGMHWALEVLKMNPDYICEIGGGVGEFYAILRALGYNGHYLIYDLDEVHAFQKKYLTEVNRQTGLNTEIDSNLFNIPNFCVSFYALGEFDDELKDWYIKNVVNDCEHGFIVWNPHSGASSEININHAFKAVPCDKEDSTIITW